MDPNAEYPYLKAAAIRPSIFTPYVKAGRFRADEPEKYAAMLAQNKTYTTWGMLAGLQIPVTWGYIQKRRIAPAPFQTRAWKLLLAAPFTAIATGLIVWQASIFRMSWKLAKEDSTATTAQIVEKVALFTEILTYAKDPNSFRPPVNAQGDVRRPNDETGKEAITAQFRNASPLKQLGEERK